jgi:DDE superfamily endonuclease
MFSSMSDSEEQGCNTSDDEDLMNLLFLHHASDTIFPAENEKRRTRRPRWIHTRLNWAEHLRKLQHEHAFNRTYRMSFTAFCKLLDLLRDDLMTMTDSQHGGYHDTDAVEPELIMAIGIRWLAGGSYVDIRHVYGCSVASVFRFRDMFMQAVLNCNELDIVFPDTDEDLKSTESKFAEKSSERIMIGCVGAIDGLFVKVCRPSMKACGSNPQAYFSGHYMAHGLNIQAICDSDRCFTFFGVVAPGKTSDQVAFERTSIHKRIMALPMGKYLVGDAAYQVSDVVLVPFTGSQRQDPGRDAFNFFLSQLRIRIEMAFGLLQTKWCVLNRPLQVNLSTAAKVVETCARLHNFCLREDYNDGIDPDDESILNEIRTQRDSPLGWGYLPTVERIRPIPGTSLMRDVIVDRIGQLGLRRPTHNLLANRPELHHVGLM